LLALTLLPALFFVILEFALRLADCGYPSQFFVKLEGRQAYTTNPRFGWRFFPPAIARKPLTCEIPADKTDETCRVFVLGGSAAMGIPRPACGFARFLEVMLQDSYPDRRFEIVNAAMTAINSHVVLPMARDCLAHGADILVIYMGNNEVVGPYGPGTGFLGFSPRLSTIRTSVRLRATRTSQLLQRVFASEDTSTEWEGMRSFIKNPVPAHDPRLKKTYGHFTSNLSDICALATDSGVQVVVCTVATDLKDSPPFASRHRSSLTGEEQTKWQEAYQAGILSAEKEEYTRALDALQQALTIDDSHAGLHFQMGTCLLAVDRLDEARRHFVLSRDLDALRFRADTQINETIREVAASQAARGVQLADVERAFESGAAGSGRIAGRTLLYEHVHLTPEGNYQLAKVVFAEIVAALSHSTTGVGGSEPVVPSQEQCFRSVPVTKWDRYLMQLDIYRMLGLPPFVDQLHNSRRFAKERKLLEQLRLEGTSRSTVEDSREAYATALKRSTGNPALRRNFAELLEHNGELAGAEEQCRILLERFPHVAAWQNGLGSILQKRGKTSDAIYAYRKAIQLAPNLAAEGQCNIGGALLAQGRLAEAAEQYRKALAVDPKSAKAHDGLGTALYHQGATGEAIAQFRKAVQCNPDFDIALNNLGTALMRKGDLAEAVELYRSALRLNPTAVTRYHNLADALAKQGRIQESIDSYHQAIRIDPTNADSRYFLANALAANRQFAKAVDEYRGVLRLAPNHLKAGNNMGNALDALGRTDEAIEQYRQVLRIEPGFEPAERCLARVLTTRQDVGADGKDVDTKENL
jgi:tetratricopeptide (TPR) repeat protein